MLTGNKDRGGFEMQPGSRSRRSARSSRQSCKPEMNRASLAVNGVKERICAYEIVERRYSYTIASTGFGAKHFYEFLKVQFANRQEKVTIQEQSMLMLKLSGFRRPILARVVYICHYEKKERPSVTFEVYFSQDDATNKNIYGRKARPTTTSSGLRGYRYVNIIPVKEELLKYDKLWSVDLGYLGELLCSWDTKMGQNFYATMHLRQVDNDMKPITNFDPPKTCPVKIMSADAYYRYRCFERATVTLPYHRPGAMEILKKKHQKLDDDVHYLVFVRMLSHNKRLEEYPATRLAFDPKPRLRKDAICDNDFVDKIVLSENPVLNAKYDGPSNNLRSKESKRVLMRAMIILAEGRQTKDEDKDGARIRAVANQKKKFPLRRPESATPKKRPPPATGGLPVVTRLYGPVTPEQARLHLERIRRKRGRPTKEEKALREELQAVIDGDTRKTARRTAAPLKTPEAERKPTKFVLNLTKPITASCTSNTTSASVARAVKRRPEEVGGERPVKRARGRPRKYSHATEMKQELSVLISAEPTSSSSLLSTGSNSLSSESNNQLRNGAGTDSDSVTPPPPNSPSSCESGTKSSSCGVHSPLTVMANSFEMMSLDSRKTPDEPSPPPAPVAASSPADTRPILNLDLSSFSSSTSSGPEPLEQQPPEQEDPEPLAPPPLLSCMLMLDQMPNPDLDPFLLDPTLPTTDPSKCSPAHDCPASIDWNKMESIVCIPSPLRVDGSVWPVRGATPHFETIPIPFL